MFVDFQIIQKSLKPDIWTLVCKDLDGRFGGSLLPKLCVGEGFAEMRYFNAVHIHNRVLLDVLSTRRGVS